MSAGADEARVINLLVEWGLVSRAQVDALRAADPGDAPFLEHLVKSRAITAGQLREAVATVVGGPTSGDEDLPLDVAEAQGRPEAKFGKYVLLGEVGRGGASVIQRAWDTEGKRYVALKFLKASDTQSVADLIREARHVVQLRHPNVRAMYEVGCTNGQFFLAMAYLEGYTLAELIRSARARRQVSPFYDNPARYLAILRDVARAIHYAHTRTPPIVHCDLKPHNVFVDLSWRPYVVDFGVAKELKEEAGGEKGTIKGSPAYMAPEQVLGTEEVDPRTDVYGLGAILYDLLTGRPPFTGELQEVLDKNLLVAPPRPSEVLRARSKISEGTARILLIPPEVEAVCMRCLEKEKKDRYPSGREVAEALDAVIREKVVTQKSERELADEAITLIETSRGRWAGAAKPKPLVAAGIAALALLAIVVKIFVFPSREHEGRLLVQREMTALAARLELESAEGGYRNYVVTADDRGAEPWVEAQIGDLANIRAMRRELVAHLAAKLPEFRELHLADGATLQKAKVKRATEFVLDVQSKTGRQELSWSAVHPKSVLLMVRDVPKLSPEARLGAVSYACKNGLPEAKSLMGPLEGDYKRRAQDLINFSQ